MTANEKRIEALFRELVPTSGAAATVAGEITRAINRLVYRNYNDGDHLGVGYGKETCNPAGRYLKAECEGEVAEMVDACWGITNDKAYDVLPRRKKAGGRGKGRVGQQHDGGRP